MENVFFFFILKSKSKTFIHSRFITHKVYLKYISSVFFLFVCFNLHDYGLWLIKIKNPVSGFMESSLWNYGKFNMSCQKVKILDIILDINSHSSRKSSNHNDGERLLAWQLSRRHTSTPSKGRISHVRPLLKELAVCRALYQNMFKESWLEEKCLLGKGAKAR